MQYARFSSLVRNVIRHRARVVIKCMKSFPSSYLQVPNFIAHRRRHCYANCISSWLSFGVCLSGSLSAWVYASRNGILLLPLYVHKMPDRANEWRVHTRCQSIFAAAERFHVSNIDLTSFYFSALFSPLILVILLFFWPPMHWSTFRWQKKMRIMMQSRQNEENDLRNETSHQINQAFLFLS